MKHVKQFGVILAVSLLGELLNRAIPLPIPASIYGLVIMLLCLCCGLIRLDMVKTVSGFLLEIMQILFIPAGVGLIASWELLRPDLAAYAAITIVSTFAVMIVSGRVTQAVIRRSKGKGGAQ